MPRLTALRFANPNGMDSLAPARSALRGLRLRRFPFAVSETAQVKSISPGLAVPPSLRYGATSRASLGNRPHQFINAEGVWCWRTATGTSPPG